MRQLQVVLKKTERLLLVAVVDRMVIAQASFVVEVA
jgi:hypothetical protein